MIGLRTSAKTVPAALVLAALVLVATVLGFVSGLLRPSHDFATMYAAARAIADSRTANVYDYATLSQLNVAHHYVGEPLYPFTYPPFTLLVLRPLALLPIDAARVVWSALVYVALLATALLLVDSVARLARRQENGVNGRVRSLIETTALPLGNWKFPLLPFALATAVLLLTLPLFDAAYWGQATILVVFLLALALHAATRGSFWLAGAAGGLVAGFASWSPVVGLSALAILVLVAFLLQGYWKAAAASVGTMALVFLLSLVVVPPDAYTSFQAQQNFLSGVYSISGHNMSLSGLLANALVITEHTNTSSLLQGVQLGALLSVVVLVITLVAALGSLAPRLLGRRNGPPTTAADRFSWPLLALLLTVPMLAPLVWPSEAMITPLAALVLLGYLVTQGEWHIVARLAVAASVLALALCIVAQVSGSDLQNLPQGEPVLALYLLRPLAALLVWVGALAIVAGATVSQLRGASLGSGAQRVPSSSSTTTTQA